MKDYCSLFVELSLQQCTKNDYANKLKVEKHNAASEKLKKLQDEMKQNVSEDILYVLLNHEDDRVKVNAASFCLQSEILVEQSVLTLEKIIDVSDEDAFCYARKMAQKEGVAVGISSGAALAAGVKLAGMEENHGKNIVVILPDTGERYLSCGLFKE